MSILFSLIDVIKWLAFFCGIIAVLAVIGIGLGCAILFIAMNWATVLEKDLIIIRRIIGWRTSLWYVRDSHKGIKEFGIWTMGSEEFVLKRSIRETIVFSEPLWEIYLLNKQNKHETVISFFPDRTMEVWENLNGRRWIGFRITRAELKDSRFGKLVERAETLQRETEKRFKPILNEKI